MNDVSQLLYLLQLQNMSAWQTNQTDKGDLNSSDSSLLFAALLQAALAGSNPDDTADILSSLLDKQGIGSQYNNQAGGYNVSHLSGANNSADDDKNGGSASLEELMRTMGQKYGLDSNLIRQVVQAESGFDTEAVSGAGAMGLMQLMPQTAKTYGVQDPFDPRQNLEGGVRFLKDLMSRYGGNIPLALAAYNAGPRAVEKYNGIPPYQETQTYVKKIMAGLQSNDQKTFDQKA